MIVAWVMLNGGVALIIALTKVVHQGYLVSPLLFITITHPILVMFLRLETNGDIMGLNSINGRKVVA